MNISIFVIFQIIYFYFKQDKKIKKKNIILTILSLKKISPIDMADVNIKGFYYQGVKYPLFENIEQNLRQLPSMPIRNDDVLLLAYPKSGTHWLWEVINMVVNENTTYMKVNKEEFFLEANKQEKLATIKSPRVLNSHLTLKLLPREILTKKIKIIFVARNPKDVILSDYWHNHQLNKLIGFDGSFNDFFQYFLEEKTLFGSWFDYMLKYQKDFAENPELPVHIVMYENIKEDPVKEIKNVAKFLGKDLNKDLCAEIAEKCSFNQLKNAKPPPFHQTRTPGGSLFRKGVIGDWKNYFTVAQNELFDKVFKEKAKDLKLQFRYEL